MGLGRKEERAKGECKNIEKGRKRVRESEK
jgi:hypothetical protein